MVENLGGGLKYFFIFIPKLGEVIQFDEHTFQMGWFNHQLETNNACTFFHYPSRRLHLQHYCHAGAKDILLPVGSCQSFQSMRTRASMFFLVQDGDANIEFQILNSVG